MSEVIEKLKLALEYENEGSPGRDVISHSEIWEAAEQLFDRIQSLEAPFILTDTPPSEPGWYWMKEYSDSIVEIMRLHDIGDESLLTEDGRWVLGLEYAEWGSAPLPLPMGGDDE